MTDDAITRRLRRAMAANGETLSLPRGRAQRHQLGIHTRDTAGRITRRHCSIAGLASDYLIL